MIQTHTIVKIADNSGGKIARVFTILGGHRHRYARIGDLVVVSIQTAEPRKQVKKKEVLRAVIVRTKQPTRRKDGSYVIFDENAAVLVEKSGKEMVLKGNRVFGPVPRELVERGWQSIASAAPEVI